MKNSQNDLKLYIIVQSSLSRYMKFGEIEISNQQKGI